MENEMTNDAAVAEIRNKFGDPEAFAEREIVVTGDIQHLPIGTTLVPATTVAELRARIAELEAALRMARDEIGGLPHSLGYEFTHLPRIDAALTKETP